MIAVAGHRHAENSYTRLLAWTLGYDNDSPMALAIQRRWLSYLGEDVSSRLKVYLELQTEGGRPDVVLQNEKRLVVVEAKTRSSEHEAATTGKSQTEAYLTYARAALGVPSTVEGLTVFLTMDGREPVATEACASSFAMVALAILEVLDGGADSVSRGWPYRAVALHWLNHTMGQRFDIRDFVGKCGAAANDDKILFGLLPALAHLERLVPMKGNSI